jgi:hypothetical protein
MGAAVTAAIDGKALILRTGVDSTAWTVLLTVIAIRTATGGHAQTSPKSDDTKKTDPMTIAPKIVGDHLKKMYKQTKGHEQMSGAQRKKMADRTTGKT